MVGFRRGAIAALAALLVAAAMLLVREAPAQEPLRGVALVIGNASYESLPPLANPAADARAVEALLSGLGFDTTLASDRDARRLTRDLEGFVEDAADADVAVLYYAGHGIEAGGENFLVPVDADASALDTAFERLVPLSKIVAELQAAVPVAIVLLDACRDNPFPLDATLKLPSGEAAPVAASGLSLGGLSLGGARGASAMPAVSAAADGGIVIGFAAEPGKVALDGAAGEHSPYAAALVRHVSAMAGVEFGQVMRMVAWEVYLKTARRQRPWVNESLHKLLYLGVPADLPPGDEGEMLSERRALLVSIDALPDARRRQVESVAADGSVPLDALYAMLRAMGSAVPQDPSELEELLSAEAGRFAAILAEREVITSPDPEIVRLSVLADAAEREGLLEKAGELRDRAKARFRDLEPTLQQQEAAVRQRFLEGAAVFARSAETKGLAFDYLGAAADYDEAVKLVAGRDDRLAWEYKARQIKAVGSHGFLRGYAPSLQRAVELSREAIRMADSLPGRDAWAQSQVLLGSSVLTLGERNFSLPMIDDALAAFNRALAVTSREQDGRSWADIHEKLGRAYFRIGESDPASGALEKAIEAFRAATQEYDRGEDAQEWAKLTAFTAMATLRLGQHKNDRQVLEQGVEMLQDAVAESPPGSERWAMSHNSLGVAYSALQRFEQGTAYLDRSEAAYRNALTFYSPRNNLPTWTAIQVNLAQTMQKLGVARGDPALLALAARRVRLSLMAVERDYFPQRWASSQFILGNILTDLADMEKSASHFREAAEAFRASQLVHTREANATAWAAAQDRLSSALLAKAGLDRGTATLAEAVAAFRALLEEHTVEHDGPGWAIATIRIGLLLTEISRRAGNPGPAVEARAAFDAAWAYFRERGEAKYDDYLARQIRTADALLDASGYR